jgi:molecular chaperone GrpE
MVSESNDADAMPAGRRIEINTHGHDGAEGSSSAQSELAEPDWQTRAQTLQAEMASFKKRQRRLTSKAVAAERERLLRMFLPVLDNLDRALGHQEPTDLKLWKGVALVKRELMRVLSQEGLERMETLDRPFDPRLHEAVATRPSPAVSSGTVVEELQAGYLLENRLLRPARVVVAA